MGPGGHPGLLAQYFSHYIRGGIRVESVSIFFFLLVCQLLEGRDHGFTAELFIDSFTHCYVETLGGGGGQEGPLAQASHSQGSSHWS